MKRVQTFCDIPINPYYPLDDDDLRDIASQKIYSIKESVSISGRFKEDILWILSINRTGEINFDRTEGIIEIRPDGSIWYASGRLIRGEPNIYVTLRNGAQRPSWCEPIDAIIFRAKESFFDFGATFTTSNNY